MIIVSRGRNEKGLGTGRRRPHAELAEAQRKKKGFLYLVFPPRALRLCVRSSFLYSFFYFFMLP